MEWTMVRQRLMERFPQQRLAFDWPMARTTSFRIGGKADALLRAGDTQEIADAIAICKQYECPWLIIGNATNLLVLDGGIRGLVIQLQDAFSTVTVNDDRIRAQSGAALAKVARLAMERGLTGMEFASGIPGTVGGAVVMNAGAYGGEMSGLVTRVGLLTPEGEQECWDAARLEFVYRGSVFQHIRQVLLWIDLAVQPGDRVKIAREMEALNRKRQEKQPLRYPSAGSAFKRPKNGYAAQLIELAGLKGHAVGGAQVSPQHAGFIINTGNATAADVLVLMEQVRETVLMRQGVLLESEIKVVGEPAGGIK